MLVAVPTPPEHAPVSKRAHAVPPPVLPRVAVGDELAVRECLQRYGNLVYAIARRFLRNADDVDDACQDIFVALWRSAAMFDPARGTEAVFVTFVARRRLLDRLRTVGTRALPLTDASNEVSSKSIESHVDAKLALAALEGCHEDQKRVIVLSACHGLSHDEISRELAMPLGTVKSHYARGIEKVKRALSTNENET